MHGPYRLVGRSLILLSCVLTSCHSPMPPDKSMFYSYNGTERVKDLPASHIPEVDEDVSPHGGPALSVSRKNSARVKNEEHPASPKEQPALP